MGVDTVGGEGDKCSTTTTRASPLAGAGEGDGEGARLVVPKALEPGGDRDELFNLAVELSAHL